MVSTYRWGANKRFFDNLNRAAAEQLERAQQIKNEFWTMRWNKPAAAHYRYTYAAVFAVEKPAEPLTGWQPMTLWQEQEA